MSKLRQSCLTQYLEGKGQDSDTDVELDQTMVYAAGHYAIVVPLTENFRLDPKNKYKCLSYFRKTTQRSFGNC
jgi:hypothetical protein